MKREESPDIVLPGDGREALPDPEPSEAEARGPQDRGRPLWSREAERSAVPQAPSGPRPEVWSELGGISQEAPQVKVEVPRPREGRGRLEAAQRLTAELNLQPGRPTQRTLQVCKVRGFGRNAPGKSPRLHTQNKTLRWHWVVTEKSCLFWFPNQRLTTLPLEGFSNHNGHVVKSGLGGGESEAVVGGAGAWAPQPGAPRGVCPGPTDSTGGRGRQGTPGTHGLRHRAASKTSKVKAARHLRRGAVGPVDRKCPEKASVRSWRTDQM